MYTNRDLVRNRQKLFRVNLYEEEEINRMVDLLGGGEGPLIRNIVMRTVRQIIRAKELEQRTGSRAAESLIDMMNAPQAPDIGTDCRYSLH